jgi:O-antigen ligase
MFFFLGAVIVGALLTFGAVLPYASEFLLIASIAASIFFLILKIVKYRHLGILDVALLVLSAFSVACLGAKSGLILFAMLLAWKAAAETPKAIPKFFHFLLITGLMEALLGLIQYFVAPNWILGYQNSAGSIVSGTLINRNHFAGLLEMFIPVAVGLGFISARRYYEFARVYLYVFCGALMALALVFSLSRMGLLCFLVTLALMFFLLRIHDTQRRLSAGLGLGLLALVVAGAVWIGVDTVLDRYEGLISNDELTTDGRLHVYQDSVRMIYAIPLGVGTGNYQDAFRRYQTFNLHLLFDHAHNDFLETTAEWGILAASLFWIFVVTSFALFVRTFIAGGPSEQMGILLACSGAVFSLLLHSLADFNLQIPSNAIMFFSFVGIGLGTCFQATRDRS